MPNGQFDWLVEEVLGPLRARLMEDVRGWIAGPIDAVANVLRELRDRLLNISQAATSGAWIVRSALDSAANRIRDGMAGPVYGLASILRGPLDGQKNAMFALPGHLIRGLVAPMFRQVGAVRALPGQLLGGIIGPIVQLGRGLLNLPASLVRSSRGFIESIRRALEDIGNRIRAAIREGREYVRSAIEVVRHVILQAVAQLLLGALTLLKESMAGAERTTEAVMDAMMELGGVVAQQVSQVAARGVPPELQGVLDVMGNIGASGLNILQDMVLGSGHVTPDQAGAIGTRAFLMASGLGATAHVLSTAIELLHPLRYVGLHYLSGFLANMGGFSSISNALVGTMVNVGVAIPMRYSVQARTRPMIPTPGDLQGMHRKHSLSVSEFGQNMAYWGYSDHWIDRYVEYLPADPRLFDILRMAETGLPETSPPAAAIPTLERMGIRSGGNPNWWLEMKFALAGYNWIDIPMLVDTVRKRLTHSERMRMVTTSSLLFRNGEMEEAQYRTELQGAGRTPDQIDWKVRAERLAAIHDDIGDLVTLYTDSYLKDLITEADLRVALINSGVTQHKATILTNKAAIRKQPKPTKDAKKEEEAALRRFQGVASSLYREQYRADLITADQYYGALTTIGIEDRLARVTIQLEMTKRIAQTRKADLKASEKADAKTRSGRERLFREKFRAGRIDASTYLDRLIGSGIRRDLADVTVRTERVRRQAELQEQADAQAQAETLQTQTAFARLFRAQFRTGGLDVTGYMRSLVRVGFSQDIAMAMAQQEETLRVADLEQDAEREAERTVATSQRLREQTYREQYRAGQIDGEIYLERLRDVGIGRDVALAIVELEQAKLYGIDQRAELREQERLQLAEQKAQAKLYIRAYRLDRIDDNTLTTRMLSLGIPEVIAITTVSLERLNRQADADRVLDQLIIPALRVPWELAVKRLKDQLTAGEITQQEYINELIQSGLAEQTARLIGEFT